MKLRTTKYVVKEGFINAYKNALMTLASIGVVTVSLFVFGFFWVITINLNYNTSTLKEQPEMQVFCNPELDTSQLGKLEEFVKADNRIKEYRIVSKKEAFQKAAEMLGDDKTLLEGLSEEFLPVSFIIKLNNSDDCEQVVKEFGGVQGVDNVRYSQKSIDLIKKVVYWVQIGSVFVIVMLLIISLFIISNTIKLTVFARRKEINIMKYIGATDWFIRWPFIFEGIIIGVIGGVVSFLLVGVFYSFGASKLTEGISIIKLMKLSDISLNLIVVFSLIGAFVGSVGSGISIRKYLRV
jgi:cell division transport system permease protein